MTWYGSSSPERHEQHDRGPDETIPVPPPRGRPHGQTEFSIVRLWTGGVVTALIAALLSVVGFLVVRNVMQMSILGVRPGGSVYTPTMAGYSLLAALLALAATAVMHLLLLGTPRPLFYFGWIGALCTAILVLVPLGLRMPWSEVLPTALNNLIGGVAITAIVRGTAAASVTGRRRGLPPVR